MADSRLICPVCDEGPLVLELYEETFTYREREMTVVGLERCRCDLCGADPVLEDQIRCNHRAVTDAKRRVDGLLTGDEIRAIRDQLGLTQKHAADLFGGGANAFSKYERGDVMQSASMDRLLRMVQRYPVLLEELRDLSGEPVGEPEARPSGYALRERVEVDARCWRVKKRPDNVIAVSCKAWGLSAA
ncbi:MAG: type II toxin-antitoxin system MqsA family antitoxin [Gammaproteobacteria bacterium]